MHRARVALLLATACGVLSVAAMTAASQVWTFPYPRALFLTGASGLGFCAFVLGIGATLLWPENEGRPDRSVFSMSWPAQLAFWAFVAFASYHGLLGLFALQQVGGCGSWQLEKLCEKTDATAGEEERAEILSRVRPGGIFRWPFRSVLSK